MKRILLIMVLIVALIDFRGPLARDLEGLNHAHAQTGGGPSTVLRAGSSTLLGAGYDLTWWTMDGGGGTSAAGPYTLGGTISQPDASAVMSGGGFTLVGGFWIGGASQYQVYLPVVLK